MNKNKSFILGMLAVLLIFGLVGCDMVADLIDKTDGNPKVVTYTSKDSSGVTYKLTITDDTSYKLEVIGGGTIKTSTGTAVISGSTILLSKGGTVATVTTSGGNMIAISGTITFDNGMSEVVTTSLTPQTGGDSGPTETMYHAVYRKSSKTLTTIMESATAEAWYSSVIYDPAQEWVMITGPNATAAYTWANNGGALPWMIGAGALEGETDATWNQLINMQVDGDGATITQRAALNANKANDQFAMMVQVTGARHAVLVYITKNGSTGTPGTTQPGGSGSTLKAKLDAAKTGGPTSTITFNDESLATYFFDRAFNGKTITLKGEGDGKNTITLSGNGNLFTISGGTLILDNVILKGHDGNNSSLVAIWGGTLKMQGTAKITGNTTHDGGGVSVHDGTFTMNGSSVVSGNSSATGGGVFVVGGTFTMNDSAAVRDNTASNVDGGGGVAVSFAGASFIMNGSSVVSGNTTSRHGGGVAIWNGGTFTMNDNSAVSGNSALYNGGGVAVWGNGTFKMNGGVVYGEAAYLPNGVSSSLANTTTYHGGSLSKDGGTAVYGNGTSPIIAGNQDTRLQTNDTIYGGQTGPAHY